MPHRKPTEERVTLSAAQRRARERRVWRMGLLASFAIHLGVFLLLLWRSEPIPVSPFSAAGPRAGDDQAAKGSMQALNLRTAPPAPVVPPPVPLPTIAPVKPVVFEPQRRVEVSGMENADPGLEAPGTATGQGRGDGGTAEEGRNRLTPPAPRGMIIPPTNDKLRGKQVEVWVFVNERGRVVADSTRLRPPTSDRGFNQRLIREASEWVFEPARRDGVAVASWFPYTISM